MQFLCGYQIFQYLFLRLPLDQVQLPDVLLGVINCVLRAALPISRHYNGSSVAGKVK